MLRRSGGEEVAAGVPASRPKHYRHLVWLSLEQVALGDRGFGSLLPALGQCHWLRVGDRRRGPYWDYQRLMGTCEVSCCSHIPSYKANSHREHSMYAIFPVSGYLVLWRNLTESVTMYCMLGGTRTERLLTQMKHSIQIHCQVAVCSLLFKGSMQ